MRGLRTVPACILLVGFLVAAVHAAHAEVSPGDVIDKTNWKKVQGLLPDPVLEWVKKGDFILDIEVPNFELADCFAPFQIRAFETSIGKYELDAEGGIIEAVTGKPIEQIVGLPFPKIAEDDPRLAEKLMQNNHYMQYLVGNVRCHFQSVYLNRSGYVREGGLLGMQMPMVGHPGAVKTPNPRRMEKCSLGIIKTPYDAAGSALMTWRYLDPDKQDNSFGYSPAIRRVRRMSAANRSDSLWGSNFAVDDSNGYDGKVTAFTWKFLRRQEALLPILDVDPVLPVGTRREASLASAKKGIYVPDLYRGKLHLGAFQVSVKATKDSADILDARVGTLAGSFYPVQVLLINFRQIELVVGLKDRLWDLLPVVEKERKRPDRTGCFLAFAHSLEIFQGLNRENLLPRDPAFSDKGNKLGHHLLPGFGVRDPLKPLFDGLLYDLLLARGHLVRPPSC